MRKVNCNGTQINESVTISEIVGVEVEDVRNLILAYDENGAVIPAADGTAIPVGVTLIEAGYNDITGAEAGKVKIGDAVDIQIKDMTYILAGEDIAKGTEITAKDGKAAKGVSGNYIIGIALDSANKDEYVRVQIAKYQKN